MEVNEKRQIKILLKKILCKITQMGLILDLFVPLSFIILLSCCKDEHRVYHKGAVIHNLFVLEKDYILEYLKNLGYSDFYLNKIRRNSTGTNLYLYDYYRKDRIILSISTGGKIKKLVPPADIAYLNDKEEFVAWTDDFKKGMQFKNGKIRHIPLFSDFDVDPSGQYFIVSTMKGINIEPSGQYVYGLATKEGLTEIFNVDNPDKPLGHSSARTQNN